MWLQAKACCDRIKLKITEKFCSSEAHEQVGTAMST